MASEAHAHDIPPPPAPVLAQEPAELVASLNERASAGELDAQEAWAFLHAIELTLDQAQALAWYMSFVNLYPDHAGMRFSLGELMVRMGDPNAWPQLEYAATSEPAYVPRYNHLVAALHAAQAQAQAQAQAPAPVPGGSTTAPPAPGAKPDGTPKLSVVPGGAADGSKQQAEETPPGLVGRIFESPALILASAVVVLVLLIGGGTLAKSLLGGNSDPVAEVTAAARAATADETAAAKAEAAAKAAEEAATEEALANPASEPMLDAAGQPVIGSDGEPVLVLVDEAGEPLVDDNGDPLLVDPDALRDVGGALDATAAQPQGTMVENAIPGLSNASRGKDGFSDTVSSNAKAQDEKQRAAASKLLAGPDFTYTTEQHADFVAKCEPLANLIPKGCVAYVDCMQQVVPPKEGAAFLATDAALQQKYVPAIGMCLGMY